MVNIASRHIVPIVGLQVAEIYGYFSIRQRITARSLLAIPGAQLLSTRSLGQHADGRAIATITAKHHLPGDSMRIFSRTFCVPAITTDVVDEFLDEFKRFFQMSLARDGSAAS